MISLREIGEGKISVKTLEDSAINKLRKPQEETADLEDLTDEVDDNFDKMYKGEISKSGTAILPSKRVRRILEKVGLDFKNLEKKTTNQNQEIKQNTVDKTLSTDSKSEK